MGSPRRRHSSSPKGDHKRSGRDDMDVIAVAAAVFGAIMAAALLLVAVQG